MKFIATCKLGLESLVTRQLRDMEIEVLETVDARVTFSGGAEAMAKALFWLRTAERVLLVVEEFDAETFDELFERTKAVRWKQYLKPETNIHVTGKSAKSTLFSVSDCQSIVKKAIVESLRAAYRTTNIPEGGDEIIVEVGILRNRVSLCLDCCGAGLSRRGYRTYNVAAPLSETLGAAIVLLLALSRGDTAGRSHVRLRYHADRGRHDRAKHRAGAESFVCRGGLVVSRQGGLDAGAAERRGRADEH
jgi:putative N6-adenine-specific DNA methylase